MAAAICAHLHDKTFLARFFGAAISRDSAPGLGVGWRSKAEWPRKSWIGCYSAWCSRAGGQLPYPQLGSQRPKAHMCYEPQQIAP